MNKIFSSNPELQRNAWLELRQNRMIVMPLLIGLIYIITIVIGLHPYDKLSPLRYVSLAIFHILVSVWGTKQAADAVASEINEKTWDRQRMTGLSPWKITIGKLFGPTLFQWYGAIWCLGVYFLCCFSSDNFSQDVFIGLVTIFSGMFANALGLLFSLLSITGNQSSSFSNTKINTTFFFIMALLIGYQTSSTMTIQGLLFHRNISWYGIPWGNFFNLFFVFVFLSWGVMGIYRNIRTELQYKNDSKVWLAFIVFVIIYCFGFSFHSEFTDGINFSAFDVVFLKLNFVTYFLVSITSFLLLIERKNIVDYKMFVADFNSFNFKKLNFSSPLWLISGIVSGLFLLALATLSLVHKPDSLASDNFKIFNLISDNKREFINQHLSFFYFGVLLLLIRDIFVTRFLLYCTNFKNNILIIVIYYAVMYAALPMVFGANGGQLICLFYPIPFTGYSIASFISLAFQAALAFYIYRSSYRSKYLNIFSEHQL